MHYVTKPTKNHIDRPCKPYEQSVVDRAGDERMSDRTEDSAPDIGNKLSAGGVGETGKLHLPDAEETAREYCRRRRAGKFGLRKY